MIFYRFFSLSRGKFIIFYLQIDNFLFMFLFVTIKIRFFSIYPLTKQK